MGEEGLGPPNGQRLPGSESRLRQIPPETLHQRPTGDQQDGGEHQEVGRPDDLGANRGDGGACDPSEDTSGADEAEEPLGLPGAVEVIGHQPKQRHHEHGEDVDPHVERARDPRLRQVEQPPEHEHGRCHAEKRQGDQSRFGDPVHGPGEGRHDRTHEDRAEQVGVGNQPRAEIVQDERTADRLDDVVGGDHQEEIEEGQPDLAAFAGADLHEPFGEIPDRSMHLRPESDARDQAPARLALSAQRIPAIRFAGRALPAVKHPMRRNTRLAQLGRSAGDEIAGATPTLLLHPRSQPALEGRPDVIATRAD